MRLQEIALILEKSTDLPGLGKGCRRLFDADDPREEGVPVVTTQNLEVCRLGLEGPGLWEPQRANKVRARVFAHGPEGVSSVAGTWRRLEQAESGRTSRQRRSDLVHGTASADPSLCGLI